MQSLSPGMYVRFALDIEDESQEFRDFRIGKIKHIDPLASTAIIDYEVKDIGRSATLLTCERSLHTLQRCRILADTSFIYEQTGQAGRVLITAANDWVDGHPMNYFVFLDGKTTCVSERDIQVSCTRQDPDPWTQLATYELHNPIWSTLRNCLITSISELHNMTFGLEDLVGSRVTLLAHQAEVVAKVLSDPECRYILADEVGLGKTIEACVILKGLRRRNPELKTLIITPAALIHQWHTELNQKFWLEFATTAKRGPMQQPKNSLIITTEELQNTATVWNLLRNVDWDLLIVDEAHHIPKNHLLYERIQTLSMSTPKVLILSATPIQQRATEYLALLRLLDPRRYKAISKAMFSRTLDAQDQIRRTIAYLQPTLSDDTFDPEEFKEEIEPLINYLSDDLILPPLMDRLDAEGLHAAIDIIAYISENYRLESRVIRNRRASLDIELPKRVYDTRFRYVPSVLEQETLDQLYDYVALLIERSSTALAVEYGRVLLAAAASSPNALLSLVELRLNRLRMPHLERMVDASKDVHTLLQIAAPREEQRRIAQLTQSSPHIEDELRLLGTLRWQAQRWLEDERTALAAIRRVEITDTNAGRFGTAVLAIRDALFNDPPQKTLLFSSWPQTIDALVPELKRIFGDKQVLQFRVGMTDTALQEAANLFQEQDDCLIMVCDEIGGEGRNFQIADQIIHLDIPWTPAQIEQRIGRVDRLGRTGIVRSVLPYAEGTLEHDLVNIWGEAFQLFNQSMSGMEIALEGIGDQLSQALRSSVRDGVRNLLPHMVTQAAELRKIVAEERYFEEGGINHRLRDQFTSVSNHYSDGSVLGKVLANWASLIGLGVTYSSRRQTIRFDPKRFHDKKMENAKFIPPNMEEAHRRSGRLNNLVIDGTFNRQLAVINERLVFLAPGDDPWTDALIANAIEADRGRCCAIRRSVSGLTHPCQVFELLYSLSIDPRMLFAEGFDPTHVFRAQGFLSIPTVRLIVSSTGEVLPRSHPACKSVAVPYSHKETDKHIGKRGGNPSPLSNFKMHYQREDWMTMIDQIQEAAHAHLATDFAFMEELADEAKTEFDRRAAGWRAANQRLFTHGYQPEQDVHRFERASAALIIGIKHPIFRLESICFWELIPAQGPVSG